MNINKKIIIMDDEPAFMGIVIEILVANGIQQDHIYYAQQIEEVFHMLDKYKTDITCISLDLLINDNLNILKGKSKINGLKAIETIRNKFPTIPIVCFSILKSEEFEVNECLEKYEIPYIGKYEDDSIEKLLNFITKYYVSK